MTQGWTTKPSVAGCTSARAADCGMNWRKYGSSCVAARTPRLLKSATPSCTRCAVQLRGRKGSQAPGRSYFRLFESKRWAQMGQWVPVEIARRRDTAGFGNVLSCRSAAR